VVNLTLATFLNAEFGFLGVVVYTRKQTPLLCGHWFKAELLLFAFIALRPPLIS
jgi:hypothetical protein